MKLIDKDALVAEIERLRSEYIKHTKNKVHTEWACGVVDHILSFLDTLEAKEVDLNEEPQVKESAEIQHDKEMCKENGNSLTQEPVSEDLEEAIEDAMPDANWYIEENDDTTGEDAYNSIQMGNMFKAGAKWQKEKDESTTEDLGEYINELSNQFPEVSFAKLSRIAVRVAKWQNKQMVAKAIDAQCFGFQGAALFSFKLPADKYLVGSKVKVIVIKED